MKNVRFFPLPLAAVLLVLGSLIWASEVSGQNNSVNILTWRFSTTPQVVLWVYDSQSTGPQQVTFTVTDSSGRQQSMTQVTDDLGTASVFYPGEPAYANPGEYTWVATVQGVTVGQGAFYYDQASVTVH